MGDLSAWIPEPREPPEAFVKAMRRALRLMEKYPARPDVICINGVWFKPNWRRRTRKNPRRTTWGHSRCR